MRSMARRRPLGGLMGVSPFGLSPSPLADINYEFNRMLPLVDSMMNGASTYFVRPPAVVHRWFRPVSTRTTRNSPSVEALRVPRRRMYPPARFFENRFSRFPRTADVAALSNAVFGHPDTVGSFPAKLAFPCDVLEKKREFLITADLPGLSKDVVNVTVDDERRLHITAERAERHEEKVGEDDEDVKMHVYERTYGKVERMFKLPENVEDEKIEADMKNGVLSVHIPKIPEPAKEQIPERSIKIK